MILKILLNILKKVIHFKAGKISNTFSYNLYFFLLNYIAVLEYRCYKRLSPVFMQVQTVSGCNAKCLLCPYSGTSVKSMSEETFYKVIETVKKYDLKWVYLMLQNEPMLDKDIADKVSRLKKDCPETMVEIVSNGQILDENIVKMLTDSELDILTISIDTIDMELAKKLRPGLDLSKILNNVERLVELKERKFRIFIRCTRSAYNTSKIKEMKRYFKKHKVPVVCWPAHNRNRAVDGKHLIVPRLKYTSRLFKISCGFPFSTINVLREGQVITCCQDWSGQTIGDLDGAWDSGLSEVREGLLQYDCDFCRTCSSYIMLGGKP